MYGFKHQGEVEIPRWARDLKHFYWMIRVEGRDKSKRRRYYRYVKKEKIRLVEMGVEEELVRLACRYLVDLNPVSGERLQQRLAKPSPQLSFDFIFSNA